MTNNQQSADPNKFFVFKTPGPVFYRMADHPEVRKDPSAAHVWTTAVVEIVNRENQPRPIRGVGLPSVPLNADDVLNGNILADMTLGRHTPPPTITAEGMKLYLKPRDAAPVKPGEKGTGFSGIREMVLQENVEFNLWSDGKTGFFADAKPQAPVVPLTADPSLALLATGGGIVDGAAVAKRLAEKSLVRIRTLGTFYYNWEKNTARFEVAAGANPLLPNNVEVTRLSPLGGRDHLVSQLLEIEFNGPIARAPAAGLPGQARPWIKGKAYSSLPWQCLYFLPEPQGQGLLRETLPQVAGALGSRPAFLRV